MVATQESRQEHLQAGTATAHCFACGTMLSAAAPRSTLAADLAPRVRLRPPATCIHGDAHEALVLYRDERAQRRLLQVQCRCVCMAPRRHEGAGQPPDTRKLQHGSWVRGEVGLKQGRACLGESNWHVVLHATRWSCIAGSCHIHWKPHHRLPVAVLLEPGIEDSTRGSLEYFSVRAGVVNQRR